jgi:hypothetical protein
MLFLLDKASGQELIAKDSTGLLVEIKEKYGPTTYDSGTVLIIYNGFFVLSKRNNPSNYYPCCNYAVKPFKRYIKKEENE